MVESEEVRNGLEHDIKQGFAEDEEREFGIL